MRGMSKELTRDQMYIVKLSNQKANLSDMCQKMPMTDREATHVMLGYQQAIDYLCHLIDEADE